MTAVLVLTHRGGETSEVGADTDLDALVAELDGPDDPEHPDVAVTHESGWTLIAFPSGRLVWEDVDGRGLAAHRTSVSRAEVRRLFVLLAADDVDAVASYGWQPGYGS